MQKKKVALIGYGNVGKFAAEAIISAPDLKLAGVVEKSVSPDKKQLLHILQVPIVGDIDQLGEVDIALLCIPSRFVEKMALDLLAKGINTVDAFDIHQKIVDLKNSLDKEAKKNKAVAILAAGWDPGTDSILRALMEFMAPRGISYTNFGPGMSMGHSVAARAIEGVADALAVTIPKGEGLHRRMVYVQTEPGADFKQIKKRILADTYFSDDETYVFLEEDLSKIIDMGHGVKIVRKGVAGLTHNQLFNFEMRINNPAVTSQIMVAAARAAFKQEPGAYTMIEIPMINFLYGARDDLINKFV